MNTNNHDPEPDRKSHYEKVAVLAWLKTMSRVSAACLAKNLLGWELATAMAKVADIQKNYKLIDGDALFYGWGEIFYLETGDRIVQLTEEFLERCAPDWRATLIHAMEKFPQ